MVSMVAGQLEITSETVSRTPDSTLANILWQVEKNIDRLEEQAASLDCKVPYIKRTYTSPVLVEA